MEDSFPDRPGSPHGRDGGSGRISGNGRSPSSPPPGIVGRYAIHGKLATGSMATVHFGRLLGPAGFSRPMAIKRLNPGFARDPEFVAMFLDEARLAARVQHPNVVATLDVVAKGEELFLVMDYVRGESLARLLRASRVQGIDVPLSVVASILAGTLHGLHAVHEAKSEHGEPLGVVHRAVSPQNVLVGVDGTARVIDFGVARAAARASVSRDGHMKGRLAYMAPEQLQNHGIDRRTDIFAAGVVLWEALTGRRLFDADEPDEVNRMIVSDEIPPPSVVTPTISRTLDAIVLRALSREPDDRFTTAREFAIALEQAVALASPREVGEWVERVAGDVLLHRETQVAELESSHAPAQPAIFDDDSRPNFMKTLDDRTPVPSRPSKGASTGAEWDEEPTGVFDPKRSAAAALLAARARELAAAPRKTPSRPPQSRPIPTAPISSRPGPASVRAQRTLVGGVAVLPIQPIQIFNDDNEKTIARDIPATPASKPPAAPPPLPSSRPAAALGSSPAFDDEQETTTVYDSPEDVGSKAPKTEKVPAGSPRPAQVIQVPTMPVADIGFADGRVTLPPRHQAAATARATVGQDGVATIIVKQPSEPVPAPQAVQIAQIGKQRDFWNSPVAFVGLIGLLVALAASLGLVLGRSRVRPTVVTGAPVVTDAAATATATAALPVGPVAPPPAVAPAPAPLPTAAPEASPSAAPAAADADSEPEFQVAPKKKKKATWTPPPAPAPVPAVAPTPAPVASAAPAPKPATVADSDSADAPSPYAAAKAAAVAAAKTAAPKAAPAPAPAPKPAAVDETLDINPYASK